MIIDLLTPRMKLKNKIDEIIFEAKMRGYKVTKYQAAAALTVALSITGNSQAMACQTGVKMDEAIKQDMYAVIFSCFEILKQFTFEDIKNMKTGFSSTLIKNMFK